MLKNPIELNVRKGKIFLSFARVDALIKNYNRIISTIEKNITQPNFDEVLSIYDSFKNNGRKTYQMRCITSNSFIIRCSYFINPIFFI